MIYWHIQMNQPWGRKSGKIDSTLMLKESQPVIGTGEWDDIQCRYFTGENSDGLKLSDIILVREGATPIALCRIVSDCYRDKTLEKQFHHNFYRNVEILDWYDKSQNFPQPQKTLERLINQTDSWFFIDNYYKEFNALKKMKNTSQILKYKKQIILQGPPGTGKTRSAKLLAEKMLIDDVIDEKFFRDRIKAPFEFKPVGFGKDYGLLSISSFSGNIIHFKGTSSIPSFSFTVEELYNCYKSRIWEEESFVDYPEYAKKALVKYLLNIAKEEIFNEQFKILQFHPSYTYEDFVRGIISESDGKNINYKTINKILAKFADKAHKNFVESNREIPSISKRKWLEEKLSEFAESVQNAIDTTGEYRLTDKVKIVDVDDNAFYYTGDKWFEGIKHRMKFSDILEAYLQAPINKKEFKNIETISGSAKQHYGYYYKVFGDFTNSITEEFQVTNSKTKEAKDYILIIDEINRANLTSVLGELIYALEYRGEEVDSMYEVNGSNKIVLPPNLYIIGTMNTADRSVGHIDYAIRRRFAFVDVLPEILNEDFETALFEEVSKFFVENINDKPLKRSEYLSSEFNPKDVWLGHSYFIKKDNVESSIRLEYEIIPILEEYLKDGILIDSEELRNRINNLHTFLS